VWAWCVLSSCADQQSLQQKRQRSRARAAWKLGWAARDQYFDRLLRDGSLPLAFRAIDNFTNGIATSIKSVDLNAATYQDAARLPSRLYKYISDLAEYEGGSLAGREVETSAITGRVLNLVVPRGSTTTVQRSAIAAAGRMAMTAGRYPVRIILTPL
jgi:hypothetical protein